MTSKVLAIFSDLIDNETVMLPSVYSLTAHSLNDICQNLQVPRGNILPLLRSLYKRTPGSQVQISQKLRRYIQEQFDHSLPQPFRCFDSPEDGSKKLILELLDGEKIETVIMPEKNRITLCVSSQVGCAQGCRFCHTGRMGLKRSLSSAEIISQVLVAQKLMNRPIQNIVFMGMGEPLDNLNNVLEAIDTLTNPHTLGFAPRKISVSTVGHIDGLKEIYRRNIETPLAISIHAPNDTLRSRIMPVAKKWPLKDLMNILKLIQDQRPNRSFLIQYTLMAGINDSLEHAQELSELLRPLRVKINLIPYNAVEATRFDRPNKQSIQSFRDKLHQDGYRTLVRYSKGQDIAAACGQLIC